MSNHELPYLYEINNLEKTYNGRFNLKIDFLRVLEGEILTIVGPSGAGKSTLLRLLNFLEYPSQGEIRYKNYSFTPGDELPEEIRRQVTMVFQKPLLLNQPVWNNIVYGLKLRHSSIDKPSIMNIIQQLGIQDLIHQPARKLSGGEAQRVALARALVLSPKVLILDEPTANLDPYNVSLIEEIIQKNNQIERTTIILVTHNVFQARRVAHRAMFILDGKLIEVADVKSFFSTPSDSRTKSFINGDMIY